MSKSKRRLLTLILAVMIIGGGSTAYLLVFRGSGTSCAAPLGNSKILKTQPSYTTFDAVTKFALPSPLRDPNGIVAAPDGSVWFGEQSVPGVGHLLPNGTLVEYAWPFNYSTLSSDGSSCATKTDIWGIALWHGKVWATDTTGNQLVGLDPSTGSITTLRLPKNGSFPYTLTVGPNDSLWFTELYTAQVGFVDRLGMIHEYSTPEGSKAVPSEIAFANDSTGYYVDAGEAGAGNGGVYSFNPGNFSPRGVGGGGGGTKLNLPTSLAVAEGGIWVTLHGASSLAFYNLSSHSWTNFPTSTISYLPTTLPYFVRSNGSTIWFNEHYGNKLARIDVQNHSLTEYSLAKPPVENGSALDNALTFTLGKDRAWFTGWTANYVGYVRAAYVPSFKISLSGSDYLDGKPGSQQALRIVVSGRSSVPLSLQFSTTEKESGRPSRITFMSQCCVAAFDGSVTVPVNIAVSNATGPGSYKIAITATDGLVLRSVYVTLSVAAG